MFRVLVVIGLCLSVILAETDTRRVYPNNRDVKELNDETYDEFICSNSISMVLWYSPKCKICNRMKPNYELAAKYSSIPLARINILDYEEFGEKNEVDGYPTVYFYNNGEKTEYGGSLSTVAILEYLSRYESKK